MTDEARLDLEGIDRRATARARPSPEVEPDHAIAELFEPGRLRTQVVEDRDHVADSLAHTVAAVVGPAAGQLGGRGPVDLRVAKLDERVEVTLVERLHRRLYAPDVVPHPLA